MIAISRRLKFSNKLFLLILFPLVLIKITFLYYSFFHDGDTKSTVFAAAIGLVCTVYIIIALRFVKRTSAKINNLAESALSLASGNVILNKHGRYDELDITSTAIKTHHEDIKKKWAIAQQLSQGEFNVNVNEHDGDLLDDSLLKIKQHLITIHKEEERRKWTADSLGKFVELLRSTQDINLLTNALIGNLVKTLKVNQGAVFVAKEEHGHLFLEMDACYAHERRKFVSQRIDPGEGIIGQVFLEKETTYLKQVPDNFIRITSGLGDSNPKYVLITPLKMDENVVGIIELASFREFAQHEIEFIEKISESIAFTISTFHTNEKTKQLLKESREQAEAMQAQEEELRQNQEELQSTQEEISRKYNHLFSQLTELNHQSKFDQLLSINATKKRNIEYYFGIIRNQIHTFAEDRMVVDAVKAFREAYYKIGNDVTALTSQKREHVLQYYRDEFLPRLNENTDAVARAESFLPDHVRALLLQYLYISNNPHPTGSKSKFNDAGDGSAYSEVHAMYHPLFRNFLEKFGYYDIFLLDAQTGDMLYSIFKEVDYATSLLTGIYHDTNFGTVVKEAIATTDKNFVRLIDFEPYDPSYRAPASFIASPVYDGDMKIGILVFQMPINRINQILTGDENWKEDGLGDTGETFIVGHDHKIRSVSRGLIENSVDYLNTLKRKGYDDSTLGQIRKTNTNILLENINLASVAKALKGVSGTQLEKDHHGLATLNAYAPLNIPDVQWVIISKMNEEEASQRINKLRDVN